MHASPSSASASLSAPAHGRAGTPVRANKDPGASEGSTRGNQQPWPGSSPRTILVGSDGRDLTERRTKSAGVLLGWLSLLGRRARRGGYGQRIGVAWYSIAHVVEECICTQVDTTFSQSPVYSTSYYLTILMNIILLSRSSICAPCPPPRHMRICANQPTRRGKRKAGSPAKRLPSTVSRTPSLVLLVFKQGMGGLPRYDIGSAPVLD